MVESERPRLAVIVPPGQRASELRNAIAAAVQRAGLIPIGVRRMRDGLKASGIIAGFDTIDAPSAFRLGILSESGVPVLAVVEDPAKVPAGIEYTVFRPGHELPSSFTAGLEAAFGSTAMPPSARS